MRLTKRQLKRIIREEYSRLKRRGLISEMGPGRKKYEQVKDEYGPNKKPKRRATYGGSGIKKRFVPEETEDEYYDRLAAEYDEMEDGRYEREDAMHRKQIGESRRRRLREGTMKRIYGEIQNAILEVGQEQGGELTVDDAIQAAVMVAPMMDRPGSQYDSIYEEILDIMYDMVDAGMLTGGYEDFFDVHPDYM